MKKNIINFTKNKKMKKGLMIITSLLVLNLVASNISASLIGKNRASNDKIRVEREGAYLSYVVTSKNLDFSVYVKKAENGEEALCIEHWKPAPTSIMYTKGKEILDEGYKHIYYSKANTGDDKKDYYIKQLALNYYQGEVDWVTGTLSKGTDIRDKAVALAETAKKVRDGQEESPYIEKASISVKPEDSSFTLQGDYYVTDWYTVTKSDNIKSYSVELSNAPKDIEILNESEDVVTELTKSDKKFKLRVHKSKINRSYSNIEIKLTGNYIKNRMYKYLPANTTYQELVIANGTKETVSSAKIKAKIEAKGNIKVVKNDGQGNKLSEAKFELKKDGVVMHTGKTDSNGELLFSDLENGDYELIETEPPVGYVLDRTPKEVEVKNGLNTEVVVTNEIIKGKVSVIKKDSEKDTLKLQGAEFTIYNNLGEIVDTIVTDINGYAESRLLNYGSYIMKETKSPTGYKDNSSKIHNIQISENNKNYKFEIENDIYKGKIHVIKKDSQNNQPISGVGFDIKAENVSGIAPNTLIEHIVTDEQGSAYTGDLRYGRYKIIETETPDSHWGSNNEYFVDVLEDGKVYDRDITNDAVQSKIKVIKTDGQSKMLLEGVRFKIVNAVTGEDVVFTEMIDGQQTEKTEFITNESGEFITPQPLRVGQYKLVEVEGLKGYLLSRPIEFTVSKNTAMEDVELVGKVITLEVENQPIKSGLRLIKLDAYTKTPLKGVEFRIECVEGLNKGVVYRETTDSKGEINIENLKYGKYKVTEIKALDGYVLNNEETIFEVEEDDARVEVEISNKPIESNIEIVKTDVDTGRALEGAVFEILGEADEVIETLKTNSLGYAKTKKLLYGTYTVVEKVAPQGYILDTENVNQVNVTEEGKSYKLNITNKRKDGTLQFKKTDVSDGELVEGATIEIKGLDDINKDININFVSSKEGNEFTLPVGRYEIKETIAPDNYVLNEEVGTFEIKENGEIVKAEIKNKLKEGILQFKKTDISSGEIIEGATIEIKGLDEINKDINIKFVSSKEGNEFTLPVGRYEIKETIAPDNYVLNEEVGTFEIKENGEIVKAEIKNKLKEGILQFKKTDISSGEIIEGATIEIKGLDEINKDINIKFVSSKEGNEFTLPVGRYEIKETIAPDNYVLNEEVGTFEIKENGEIVKAEIKNKLKEKEVVESKPVSKPRTGDNVFLYISIVAISVVSLVMLNLKKSRNDNNKKIDNK